jgi:hypothetical protein
MGHDVGRAFASQRLIAADAAAAAPLVAEHTRLLAA